MPWIHTWSTLTRPCLDSRCHSAVATPAVSIRTAFATSPTA